MLVSGTEKHGGQAGRSHRLKMETESKGNRRRVKSDRLENTMERRESGERTSTE